MTKSTTSLGSQEPSFKVTERLIKYLEILIGSRTSIAEIYQVNQGVIDIISGLVICQSFEGEASNLQRISIKTELNEIFTFTSNSDLSINKRVFDFLNNAHLLNKPREVWIKNLNNFSGRFSDAAQYHHIVDCIYNQVTGQLIFLRISPNYNKEPAQKDSANTQTQDQESTNHIALPIEVRFKGKFTEKQRSAFQLASARWGEILRGNLPKVEIDGELIDGVVITAVGESIDGYGEKLAQSFPQQLRPISSLPATGRMEFDIVDLEHMEANGNLVNVIVHEMAHVLGFGSLWQQMDLIQNPNSNNPTFIGGNAMREFANLLETNTPIPVPIENDGGLGTRGGHWRDYVFGNEVMTSYISRSLNPISRLTIAAFEDMGYGVNYNRAESYFLPKNN